MITKKCHKLENTLKEEDEKNNEEENNGPQEILIVDVNNNLEDSEEEKDQEGQDGDDQNEKSINYSKAKLSKPKPILNVDSNSINFTDYQVNDNKYSNYPNYPKYSNYSNTRYNFYTGSGSSYYLPKSYSFYCNSNYNNGFKNNNITNNHFNSLASSNDYTYKYRNGGSNPYGLNRNYINNNPYANNNDNHSITYSFYLQQKPNNLRSRSYVKLQNKYNIDDKPDNLRNSNGKGSYLSMSHRTLPYGNNDGTQTNLYPTKERVTYVLNYYKNNVGSNINNKNNTYRAYNKSLPYKLNYNYIYN